jgi:hypothetical protein
MLVCGLYGMAERTAYKVTNKVCGEEFRLDYAMPLIHTCIRTAGSALANSINPDQCDYFDRYVQVRCHSVPVYVRNTGITGNGLSRNLRLYRKRKCFD